MMKIYLFGFLLLGLFNSGLANSDSLLNALDETIVNQNRYIDEKNDRINTLIRSLFVHKGSNPLKEFEIYQELFHEYRSFQYDSAFKYVLQQIATATSLSDKAKVARAKLNLSFVLGSSGKYKEAFDTLRTIHPSSLPEALMIDYYEQMGRIYYDLAAYNNDNYYSFITGDLGNKYIDSAIFLCEPKTLQYYRLSGLKAQATGNHDQAISIFQSIIDEFDITLHQYAMAAYSLGKINQALNDHEAYLEMVVRSAIADIKSCTKENLSTLELAGYMFNKGEMARASTYIHQAARDAEFYGAKHRMLQVSALLQIIDNTSIVNEQYRSNRLLTFLVVLSGASLVIIAFALILFKQYQKLKLTKQNLGLAYEKLSDLNEKLLEANTIKEEYIGYSFAKDSDYLEKMDKFKQEIAARLNQRKYDAIQYSLKLFDLEHEKVGLYKKFDEIFLKLFPNFIPYFTFSFTDAIGGNGFLAVYGAAIILGNSNLIHRKSLVKFFDGIAWLMQIVMFLTLGLLVFPSNIVPILGEGILISIFLILIARPIAVFIMLSRASDLNVRKKLFISWVGLRGAAPIVFATYPLIAGVHYADTIFNLVFFISVSSVVLQGTTLSLMAKFLHVGVPEQVKRKFPLDLELKENSKSELIELDIPENSACIGKQIVQLNLPKSSLIVLIYRENKYVTPSGETEIQGGDHLLILADNKASRENVYESFGIKME